MKIIILFFLLLCNVFLFGQGKDLTSFYEAIGEPVFINKKVIAYTFSQAEVKNGVTSELKMNKPNVHNPFNIFISSDENQATIRINNKNFREDLVYRYKKIYKMKSMDSTPHQYNFTNSQCNATYSVPQNSNEHQTLIIGCEDSNRNGLVVIFTISQFDDL